LYRQGLFIDHGFQWRPQWTHKRPLEEI